MGYGSREAYLEAKPTIKAKAKDMVEHYLDVELDDDPDLQASFTEALEKIFQDF
jgi:type I restriction enzyme, R subunit